MCPWTEDVPCTLMLGWSIRGGALHCHAYMRSSDIWLGIPYDAFNFSFLSAYVREQLEALYGEGYALGTLHLTAGSSHLYKRNLEAAAATLGADDARPCRPMPNNWRRTMDSLRYARQQSNAFEPKSHGCLWNFWEADDET